MAAGNGISTRVALPIDSGVLVRVKDVEAARKAGVPWPVIAARLGVSVHSARAVAESGKDTTIAARPRRLPKNGEVISIPMATIESSRAMGKSWAAIAKPYGVKMHTLAQAYKFAKPRGEDTLTLTPTGSRPKNKKQRKQANRPRSDKDGDVSVSLAEVDAAVAHGESLAAVARRLGVTNATLRWAMRSAVKRGLSTVTMRPRRRSAPKQSTSIERAEPVALAEVNKALAIDVPPRPETAAVNALRAVMERNGISKITIDLENGRVSVAATESFPIGGGQ